MNVRVKEATVKTVTVQLRIIEVNSKQMTLSVFKQLRIEYGSCAVKNMFGYVRCNLPLTPDLDIKCGVWLVCVTNDDELIRIPMEGVQFPADQQLFIAV